MRVKPEIAIYLAVEQQAHEVQINHNAYRKSVENQLNFVNEVWLVFPRFKRITAIYGDFIFSQKKNLLCTQMAVRMDVRLRFFFSLARIKRLASS